SRRRRRRRTGWSRERRARRILSRKSVMSNDAFTDDEPIEAEPPPTEVAHFERHDPLEPEPPPSRVDPVVVPRWVQMVTLPLALLGAWALARASGPVFLLFLVAGVTALILNPVVTLLQRLHLPRGPAVFAVYLGLFATLTGVGFLPANPVSNQAQS